MYVQAFINWQYKLFANTASTANSDNFTLASSKGDKIGKFWKTWNLPELKGNCQFSFEEPARYLE